VPVLWFEVRVNVPAELGEAVANFLVESGAPGIQYDELISTVSLVAHFRDDPPLDALRRFCADLGCESASPEFIRVRRIAEENWAEDWKLHFVPHIVGERLCVCPSWAATPPPGRLAIVIDPGMAFGTGLHGTTHGCLELLESAVRRQPIARALDVGTGSGILAIALAKLGVSELWAVDTDPQACAVASENATRNGVDTQVRIRSSLDDVRGTFDLVVANLFAGALEQLAQRFVRLLEHNGVLICSGLLSNEEDRLRSAYAALGFTLEQRYADPPWVTLSWRTVSS
jgi:ribosomal protein L11 methyltransferase